MTRVIHRERKKERKKKLSPEMNKLKKIVLFVGFALWILFILLE